MKKLLKKIGNTLLGNYSIYKIYSLDLNAYQIKNALDPDIVYKGNEEETSGFSGPGSYGFSAINKSDETVLCQCWYWFGDRYKERNFWPLLKNEAKLIDIETRKAARGKGIAPKLISYSAINMKKNGFKKLYARIWHSNTPSIKAFTKVGWKPVCTIIDIYPMGRKIRIKIPL